MATPWSVGGDCGGNDLYVTTASALECAELCRDDLGCAGFSHRAWDNRCVPKSADCGLPSASDHAFFRKNLDFEPIGGDCGGNDLSVTTATPVDCRARGQARLLIWEDHAELVVGSRALDTLGGIEGWAASVAKAASLPPSQGRVAGS